MMNSNLFINQHLLWPVVGFSFAIWLVYLWKEWSDFPRPKFYIKAFISLIALLALALMFLEPKTETTRKEQRAILLTEGYDQVQLDSLKRVYRKLKSYNYEANEEIFAEEEVPQSLFVLGEGIKTFDFWQLDSIPTTYLRSNTPKGIIKLNYSTKNKVGKNLVVKGVYNAPVANHKLILEEPSGQAIDSMVLGSIKSKTFQLTAPLKTSGRLIYKLVEKDTSDNIITSDPLPLVVEKRTPLQILIVNDFPTFETKYLKNFLTEEGHQVIVKSKLTKDRYKYEYFNTDRRTSINITQDNLKPFDVFVIDAVTLSKLSRSIIEQLKSAIQEQGLGVFIQPNNAYFESRKRLSSFNFTRDKAAQVTLTNAPKDKISKYLFHFKDANTQHILFSSESNSVSAYHRLGLGRVATTTLQNTYELLLDGKNDLYQHIWSKTLEAISKKDTPTTKWEDASQISYVNEPYNFALRTINPEPIIKSDNRFGVPLKRNIDLKDLWFGNFFPQEEGWHRLVTQDSSALEFYTSNNTHWKTLSSYNTSLENMRHYGNNENKTVKVPASSNPVNLTWFYVIYLLGIGYLWLEPKL